jgi:hypothetical protein
VLPNDVSDEYGKMSDRYEIWRDDALDEVLAIIDGIKS